MDKELLSNINKLLDEKLIPINKEIETIKLDISELKLEIKNSSQSKKNNNILHEKINKDLDYIKGYYYNRTQ
ncbi:hypothetical protein [Terrisporobacter glycolicus]|uniref:Uncharacterized protein n=1 Tax=Terrisporobacter glycolicus ATCC 14880 = DSM 1288 TaxID=1121315 RepID=A0ABZ2ERC0_9FIRM|nr:hypothetical protein [Terrisporobacter glycolicus]